MRAAGVLEQRDAPARASSRRHGSSRAAGVLAAPDRGSRHAAEAEMVVRRPVRQVRSRPAAARLQGLSRRLPDLSRPDAGVLPQSRRAGRARLLAGAGRRPSPPNTRSPTDPNDQGEMVERTGRPADRFPSPFRTTRRRAPRYNAVPPDLSVIAKARGYRARLPRASSSIIFTQYQEHGADYIVALLHGLRGPARGRHVAAGHASTTNISPATPSRCRRRCRTAASTTPTARRRRVDQYARDVTAFLMWAAEPHLEARKRIGFQVIIFLLVLSGLLYFTKKKVWRRGRAEPGERVARAGSMPADVATCNRMRQPRRGRHEPMTKCVLGIIGGSGIYDLPGLEKVRAEDGHEPVGRAVGAAAGRRDRRPAGGVPVAPRQGPPAVALRHQLPRQYRRAQARRRHRSRLALGLRLVQGGAAARHLRAGRPVRRPHPQARELVLRQGLRRARLDGASGVAAAAHPSRGGSRGGRASRSCATAPTSAWKARSSPRWPRASPTSSSAIR